MKEIITTTYQCEICGEEYENKDQAAECEKTHMEGRAIVGQRYYSILNHDKRSCVYPYEIDVLVTDGETTKIMTYEHKAPAFGNKYL